MDGGLSEVVMTKTKDEIQVEVLKMARELVMNEYVDKRAKLHNRWLVESDYMWKHKKVRLAYPELPQHPTENDIVTRARVLFDFISPKKEVEQVKQNEPAKDTETAKPEEVVTEKEPEVTQAPETTTETNSEPNPEPESVNKPELQKMPTVDVNPDINWDIDSVKSANEPRDIKSLEKELENLNNLRLMRDIEENSSTTGKFIPVLMERLEKLKSNLYRP